MKKQIESKKEDAIGVINWAKIQHVNFQETRRESGHFRLRRQNQIQKIKSFSLSVMQ